MKKYIFILVSFFILIKANCQIFGWEDNRFLDSNKLSKKIQDKPVKLENIADFKLNLNVSKEIKKRLLKLLDYHWSIDDYENYIQTQKSKIDNRSSFIEYAQFMYPKDNLKYLKCYDSLTFDLEHKIRTDLIKSNFLKVNDNVLMVNAYLDFKEADSLFLKFYNDSIHYNKNVLKLCIARRGNIKYQDEIIKNCNYLAIQNERDWLDYYNAVGSQLIFLATQESIYKLNEWLIVNTNYTNPLYKHSRNRNQYNVVAHLVSIIENDEFRNGVGKYVNLKDLPDYWENLDVIDFAKQWLINKKGKYKINRYFYPF
jgi:hypothetical protein